MPSSLALNLTPSSTAPVSPESTIRGILLPRIVCGAVTSCATASNTGSATLRTMIGETMSRRRRTVKDSAGSEELQER
jgi:hypothetical protein